MSIHSERLENNKKQVDLLKERAKLDIKDIMKKKLYQY